MLVAGRFEIVDVAGRGGMGTVHRARDRATGAIVALKSIRCATVDARARFEREARVLAALKHPAIVGFIAYGIEADTAYLAMEWNDGPDLERRLAEGPLGPHEALAVATRIADALGAVHDAGVVHRDVKPANIVLAPSGARLIDFGIARRLATDAPVTGHLVGTRGYYAPEQAAVGRPVDARADVFALGAVLFACLVGRPPFEAADPTTLLAKVLLEPAPRASDLRRGISPAIDAVLARLLAKDPAERPADGNAAATLLRGIDPAVAERDEALGPQRVATIAFVRTGGTSADDLTATEAPDLGALSRLAAVQGTQLDLLASGALLLTVAAGSAREQADRTARAALAVASATGAPAGVAIGRAAVERAAALATEPGSVRVDPDLVALLEPTFELVADRLDGPRAPSNARRAVGNTPFVGRDRELETARALVAESASERVTRVLLVTAPPGGGKTRLADEVAAQIDPGTTVARVTADVEAAGSPLLLAGRIVRAVAGADLAGRVARHVPEEDRARVTVFLREIAGLPGEDGHALLLAARDDLRLMQAQMERAFVEWLGAECAAAPFVIVIDDAHWGDVPSLQFVFAAAQRLEHQPYSLLLFGRDEVKERFPELARSPTLQELRLTPLVPRAAQALAAAALGTDATPEVIERIARLGAGNPFFIEELARAWTLHRTDQLPVTVLATVQAHIARTPAPARRVLHAASVLGLTFSAAAAQAVTMDGDCDAWLDVLSKDELLVRARGGGYAFRHALVRETAYALLEPQDRQAAHLRAASFLASSGERDPLTLAVHYESAARPDEAATWFARAALRALGGGDARGAYAAASRGAQHAAGTARAELRWIESEASVWLGELERAMKTCNEALVGVESGSTTWYRAVFLAMMISTQLGDMGSIGRLVESLAAQHPAPPFDVPHTRAWMIATRFAAAGGRKDAARLFLDRLVAAEPTLSPSSTADAYVEGGRFYWHSWCEWNPGARHRTVPPTIAAFARTGDLVNMRMGRAHLAWGLLSFGAYDEVAAAMRELLAEAEGQPLIANLARAMLAGALAGRGAAAEADAVAAAIPRHDAFAFVVAATHRADAHRRAGTYEQAFAAARAAIEGSAGMLPVHAHALGALAHVHLAAGDRAAAEEVAARAAALESRHVVVVEGHDRIHGVLAKARGEVADVAGIEARAADISDASYRAGYVRIARDLY